jgi:hypothetical protein
VKKRVCFACFLKIAKRIFSSKNGVQTKRKEAKKGQNKRKREEI